MKLSERILKCLGFTYKASETDENLLDHEISLCGLTITAVINNLCERIEGLINDSEKRDKGCDYCSKYNNFSCAICESDEETCSACNRGDKFNPPNYCKHCGKKLK